jgi:hypothetical protein
VKKEKKDRATQELDDLRISIGLEPIRKSATTKVQAKAFAAEEVDPLARQLDVLKTMFEQKKNDDYFANFDYASQRALFTMKTRRASEFGDIRIYTPDEMLKTIFAKSNVPTSIDWEELE